MPMMKKVAKESQDSNVWSNLRGSELPSKFIPYEENQLQWRSLTFGEVKKIDPNNMSEAMVLEVYRNVIRGIDVENITYPDYKFIMIYVALQTTPTKQWGVISDCPDCKKENKMTVDATMFDFKDIEVKSLPVKIKVSDNREIHLDALRVKDVPRLLEIPDNLDIEISTLSLMVRNMEFDEAYEVMSNLDMETAALVRAVEGKIFHGLKPVPYTCNHCGFNYRVVVGLEVADLLPFRGLQEFDRDKILSGI